MSVKKYPKHLAVIMDGNGRWAKKRGHSRFWGHTRGTEVAQKIIEHCAENTPIEYLTLYAFSTENWLRPKEEVNFLFQLLEKHLIKKRQQFLESDIVLRTIGDLSALPNGLNKQIEALKEETKNNSGLKLTLALNYGGRQEIISAVNQLLAQSKKEISEDDFTKELLYPELPDPDLILRTSGEKRISNFLIWQAAYSELYFSDVLWPDFSVENLEEAFLDYNIRERRFGGLNHDPEAHA